MKVTGYHPTYGSPGYPSCCGYHGCQGCRLPEVVTVATGNRHGTAEAESRNKTIYITKQAGPEDAPIGIGGRNPQDFFQTETGAQSRAHGLKFPDNGGMQHG